MSQNHPEKDKKIYQRDNMRFSRPTRKSVAPDRSEGGKDSESTDMWWNSIPGRKNSKCKRPEV